MRLHLREKIRNFFILQVLLFSTVAVWAQPVTVSGKITDNKAIGLAGVTVTVKGTSTAKITDENGSFSLVVPNSNAVLLISSVGYVAQEIPVNGQRKINVSMVPDNQGLGEVVVIGYGSQLRKAVTGAVQTVQAKEFRDLPVSQIAQKLQGRLAGVQINQVTGKPGSGMSVRIRGQLSVSAGSDPLYVIDGFPISGNISNVNPDEIENISILKDAASTSLYGSRAANGVVLVTTKKAKKGQTSVNFNTYAGLQEVPSSDAELQPDAFFQ